MRTSFLSGHRRALVQDLESRRLFCGTEGLPSGGPANGGHANGDGSTTYTTLFVRAVYSNNANGTLADADVAANLAWINTQYAADSFGKVHFDFTATPIINLGVAPQPGYQPGTSVATAIADAAILSPLYDAALFDGVLVYLPSVGGETVGGQGVGKNAYVFNYLRPAIEMPFVQVATCSLSRSISALRAAGRGPLATLTTTVS